MKTLDAILADIHEGADLHHYAAHAAASELVQNWKAAMRDGTALADLVGDVDQTMVILAKFKNEACRLCTEPHGLAALLATHRANGTLIGKGQRFELYDDDPHGFRILRLSDGKVAAFYGDDSCERFRDHFNGEEMPEDDDIAGDNAAPTDDVGEWAEAEGEF